MTDNIISQVYQAVEDALAAGWSINQIAIAAGVQQPSLSKWYSGARKDLYGETYAALCQHFGMRLTKPNIGKPPHSSGEIREPRRKPKAKSARPKAKRSKRKSK